MGAEKHRIYREAVYESELGPPEQRFAADGPDQVEILAFGRDFAPAGAIDEGYVVLTNGMSDRLMPLPDAAARDHTPRAELMWYVREPTRDIVNNIRWLAEFPFIDDTWLGFGHRVPMPWPPVQGSDFKTFLLLTPIIKPDKRIAEKLTIEGERVEILTVHLISDAEYRFIKAEGLDAFLDILDNHHYSQILEPQRGSYIQMN